MARFRRRNPGIVEYIIIIILILVTIIATANYILNGYQTITTDKDRVYVGQCYSDTDLKVCYLTNIKCLSCLTIANAKGEKPHCTSCVGKISIDGYEISLSGTHLSVDKVQSYPSPIPK